MKFLKRNPIKYAFILCAILVVCLLTMEITGQNETFADKSPLFLVYQFIAPAVIWYLGMNEKKKMLQGKLSYKQAFYEGFKISVVFGLISPFIFAAYYLFINPNILNGYVRETYKMYETPVGIVIAVDMLIQFMSALIFGTLYSAIIALFVRTKSK